MTFKLFESSKNKETQRAIELARIKFPEMKFYDIEANPENLKEYIDSCFGNKDGSPRIAQYVLIYNKSSQKLAIKIPSFNHMNSLEFANE